MTGAEIIAFVDRLEVRAVKFDEFRDLKPAEWEAIKGLLIDRNHVDLQRYVSAVHKVRMKMKPKKSVRPRTYSEDEIIRELEGLN
jgi:hypothetical protein